MVKTNRNTDFSVHIECEALDLHTGWFICCPTVCWNGTKTKVSSYNTYSVAPWCWGKKSRETVHRHDTGSEGLPSDLVHLNVRCQQVAGPGDPAWSRTAELSWIGGQVLLLHLPTPVPVSFLQGSARPGFSYSLSRPWPKCHHFLWDMAHFPPQHILYFLTTLLSNMKPHWNYLLTCLTCFSCQGRDWAVFPKPFSLFPTPLVSKDLNRSEIAQPALGK